MAHPYQSRRQFIQQTSLTLSTLMLPSLVSAAAQNAEQGESGKFPQAPDAKTLPTAEVGTTGRVLPRLGFGAFPICQLPDEEVAIGIVSHAINRGIRYFDTAPSYGNGKSEIRVGKAVRQSKISRDKFYLATKTLERSADGARRELEQSLKRLQVDYVDAVQVHAVHDDLETVFAENSVLKGLEKAQEEGLLRAIAITGHVNPKYLIECLRRYDFATALVPVNPVDTKHLSFVRDFLPVAIEKKVGVIAMKVYGGGSLLRPGGKVTAGELLQYALSQPGVDIVVPGCEKIEYIDEAYTAVLDFEENLTADAQQALEEKIGPHQGRTSEWYKENS